MTDDNGERDEEATTPRSPRRWTRRRGTKRLGVEDLDPRVAPWSHSIRFDSHTIVPCSTVQRTVCVWGQHLSTKSSPTPYYTMPYHTTPHRSIPTAIPNHTTSGQVTCFGFGLALLARLGFDCLAAWLV
ncbi:GD12987 [Drosophila simulans]|uniref:GD12987 n=1 Tax=Drosophila simulans TaxID=7240 RepID=B4QM26_DROSI|nr:GD12987 [Drosophila simulans]